MYNFVMKPTLLSRGDYSTPKAVETNVKTIVWILSGARHCNSSVGRGLTELKVCLKDRKPGLHSTKQGRKKKI